MLREGLHLLSVQKAQAGQCRKRADKCIAVCTTVTLKLTREQHWLDTCANCCPSKLVQLLWSLLPMQADGPQNSVCQRHLFQYPRKSSSVHAQHEECCMGRFDLAQHPMLTNNAREEAAPKSADLLLMECSVDCASLPEVEGSPVEHVMAACLLHGIVTGALARCPRQTHSSYA